MERVEFILGPSKGYSTFLWSIYLGAIASIVWIPILVFLKIIGITLLTLYSWQLLDLHGRRISKKAVIRVWQDSKGRWGCQTKIGHSITGELKGDSFKSAWLTILHFQLRNRSFKVIIPIDAMNLTGYRILSARLNQHLFN